MSIWATIVGFFAARTLAPVAPAPVPAQPRIEPPPPKLPQVTDELLHALAHREPRHPKAPPHPFLGLPTPPPGVRPVGDPVPKGMAMDEAGLGGAAGALGGAWGAWATSGYYGDGLWFLGYPYLGELSQRSEYRNLTETVAEEMTRKWVDLNVTGGDNKSDRVMALHAAMKKFQLREIFKRALERDGFFGMGPIYIDTGATDNPEELKKPLIIDKAKIGKGSLHGFVSVDPTWMSPVNYNSTDPLKPDYFVPTMWYVMTKQVHASRFLFIRSREVPDILKAAYNFGGMSLSQLAKPAIDNFLRTRQSVSDIVHSFSVFILKSDWNAILADPVIMMNRLSAFVLGRDNKGLMLIDKDREELENIAVPLGTLDNLQAQAQEQMAFPSQQPLIKLLGSTPRGLNASPDGEIRTWYDRVHAKQESTIAALLLRALQVIQLSEFGEVDPTIEAEFLALWELDDAGKAAVQKTMADTDSVRIADGIITNEEARIALAADPLSPYHGLEGPAPDPPDMGGNPDLTDPSESIEKKGAEGSETAANSGV